MFRRIRSALVLGGLWGLVWLPAGVIIALIMGWVEDPVRQGLLFELGAWTLLGACSGAVFATLLAIFERRRTVDDLSARRLTVWGAIAGGILPIVLSAVLTLLVPNIYLAPEAPAMFATLALLGAGCAWGTLKLARHGEARAATGSTAT